MKDGFIEQRPPMKRRRFRMDRTVAPGRHWLGGDPVATSFFNSLSIVFPRGEAFFIECVRPWQNRADEKLGAEIAEFIRQESAHGREHVALNRGLVEGGYDTSACEAVVDKVVDAIREKNAAARMTYTMCFEHLTAILSSAILRDDTLLAKAEPEMRRVWSWHGVEEIEHKGVCFDTWMLATRDWSPLRRYLTRTLSMLIITAGFVRNRFAAQVNLLGQDGWSARRALPAIFALRVRQGRTGAFGDEGLAGVPATQLPSVADRRPRPHPLGRIRLCRCGERTGTWCVRHRRRYRCTRRAPPETGSGGLSARPERRGRSIAFSAGRILVLRTVPCETARRRALAACFAPALLDQAGIAKADVAQYLTGRGIVDEVGRDQPVDADRLRHGDERASGFRCITPVPAVGPDPVTEHDAFVAHIQRTGTEQARTGLLPIDDQQMGQGIAGPRTCSSGGRLRGDRATARGPNCGQSGDRSPLRTVRAHLPAMAAAAAVWA